MKDNMSRELGRLERTGLFSLSLFLSECEIDGGFSDAENPRDAKLGVGCGQGAKMRFDLV